MSQQDGRGHLLPPNGSVEFLSNFLTENLDGVILLINSMTPVCTPGPPVAADTGEIHEKK